MHFFLKLSLMLSISGSVAITSATYAHEYRGATPFDERAVHAPTPIPDRVVLTWNGNPATSQAITWRTDTSVKQGYVEFAVANSNGRALETASIKADSEVLESNINTARYHHVSLENLQPETLYAYRVGDGANWSEYFHFKTASTSEKPFSFIYFGDAQNEIKTHWSRVFREAFRDAPRAAFTLHAGDLISEDNYDNQWGEWHQAPGWVNGTIPIIATPGNHEYYRADQGPWEKRFWFAKDGTQVPVTVERAEVIRDDKTLDYFTAVGTEGQQVSLLMDDDKILEIEGDIRGWLGYSKKELIGTDADKKPLLDQRQDQGTPMVSDHWRPQFTFPEQDVPAGLEETVYFTDYQGVRIISLDSNKQREAQIPWLKKVLDNNPNRWTVITFHHPLFSPAKGRDNAELRNLWKPVFDEYKVDLVLNGHDHTYARTGHIDEIPETENVPSGYQQAYDPEIGTVYVVSVSGPKMYKLTAGSFAHKTASNTQLYQIIDIDGDRLNYKAYKATGELFDTFELQKRTDKPNLLTEKAE